MESEHIVKILKTDFVTHDTKRILVEKPRDYTFTPGQATDISINTPELKTEKRPFTFTSTNDELVLEFMIKKYPGGMTEKIHELKPGDELVIGEVFGDIEYKGKGTFIAGGTGITPFLAILRQLNKEGKINDNKLIFSNKTQKDIISEKELKELLKENLILTITEEKNKNYINKKITKDFLKENIKEFNQYFYLCGPLSFTEEIENHLLDIGVREGLIIKER
jgi:ferredoxin-NADP reductase